MLDSRDGKGAVGSSDNNGACHDMAKGTVNVKNKNRSFVDDRCRCVSFFSATDASDAKSHCRFLVLAAALPLVALSQDSDWGSVGDS